MTRGVLWKTDPFMTVWWIENEERWSKVCSEFFDQWDAYNVHFLQHILHAYGVIGIHHPDQVFRDKAWNFYAEGCHKIHMIAETKEGMQYRLRDGIREGE